MTREYFCDFCELPIKGDTIEVGYDGEKLLQFHPMTCVKDPNSHKCSHNYFSLHRKLKQFVTNFYTKSDFERLDKNVITSQLLAILNNSSDQTNLN